MEWKAKKKSSVRNSRDSSAKHRPGPPRRRSLQRRRGNSNVLVRGYDRSGQLDDVRDDVRGKVAEGRRRLSARVVTAGPEDEDDPGGDDAGGDAATTLGDLPADVVAYIIELAAPIVPAYEDVRISSATLEGTAPRGPGPVFG